MSPLEIPHRLPQPPLALLGPRVDPGPVRLPRRDLDAEERARAARRLLLVERVQRTQWGTYAPLPPPPRVTPARCHITVDAPGWLLVRDPGRYER